MAPAASQGPAEILGLGGVSVRANIWSLVQYVKGLWFKPTWSLDRLWLFRNEQPATWNTHICTHVHRHTCTQTYMHAHTHMHAHTCTNTTHTNTHTPAHTQRHTHARTHTHTCTHTRTCTPAHTDTHPHTADTHTHLLRAPREGSWGPSPPSLQSPRLQHATPLSPAPHCACHFAYTLLTFLCGFVSGQLSLAENLGRQISSKLQKA